MQTSQNHIATTGRRGVAERLDRMSIRRLQPADLFDAYAAYVAALDREAAAATLLARRLAAVA